MQKLRIYDKVTALGKALPVGGILAVRSSPKRSIETAEFEVVRECSIYLCSMYLPYNYHFPNFVIRGAMPLAGYHSFKSTWANASFLEFLFISLCNFSRIFNINTWSKNFEKLLLCFLEKKHQNDKHVFFKLIYHRSMCRHVSRE